MNATPDYWKPVPIWARYMARGERAVVVTAQPAPGGFYTVTAVETSSHVRSAAEVFEQHNHRVLSERAELDEAFAIGDAFLKMWTPGALDCACEEIAPTTDETLTSRVTELDAARARIAVLEQQLRDAPVTAAARSILEDRTRGLEERIAELEQDVRLFVAAESATRDVVRANVKRLRRGIERALPRTSVSTPKLYAIACELEDAVAVAPFGLFSDATEAFVMEWRVKRTPRAPRASRSAEGAASTSVQDAEAQFAGARRLAEAVGLQAQARDAGQAARDANHGGAPEHGTTAEAASSVPAARQKARAAGKEARDASFDALCRRRESKLPRGPPTPPAPREVDHTPAKKAQKKKHPAKRGVRTKSSRKRGSS